MRDLVAKARRAAASDVPILLCGESGTGKEVLAQIIHQASPRKDNPFIPVNCAAIPKELAEAELFGHTKGAFTGSTGERAGMFELAHHGTVFLDELADMELTLQAKLMRVLQSGEIRRLGSGSFGHADFRLIAALNREPHALIRDSQLREDLYYRLCTVELVIPPLRERREDIMPIADALIANTGKFFADTAISALRDAPWPGNIRHLINSVRRAIVLSDGTIIEAKDLALQPGRKLEPRLLADMESEAVLLAMERTGGNKLAAARMLGIGRQTLYNKLRSMNQLRINHRRNVPIEQTQ